MTKNNVFMVKMRLGGLSEESGLSSCVFRFGGGGRREKLKRALRLGASEGVDFCALLRSE